GEKENGNTLYLVETVSTFQPIHDWYSKPSGLVLMHRQEYVKTGSRAEYQPTKQFLKNPLMRGDSWHWQGKGMMDVAIDGTNDVGKYFPQIASVQLSSACQCLPSTARCLLPPASCLLLPASRLLIPNPQPSEFVTSCHVRVHDHAIIAPLEVSAHE